MKCKGPGKEEYLWVSFVSTQIPMLIAEQPTHTLGRGEENVMSSFFQSIGLFLHACVSLCMYMNVKCHSLCCISM